MFGSGSSHNQVHALKRRMHVSVRVTADAKREKVIEAARGRLMIAVKEPAERNAANRRVLELVAAHHHIPKNHVRLVSGHHSPSKVFDVTL